MDYNARQARQEPPYGFLPALQRSLSSSAHPPPLIRSIGLAPDQIHASPAGLPPPPPFRNRHATQRKRGHQNNKSYGDYFDHCSLPRTCRFPLKVEAEYHAFASGHS